ncbi:MAG: aminotransferase class IV [Acidobacteriaceae bacterium]|nr:aminotransferase class IV [Acidobacteriaceae bacterium]
MRNVELDKNFQLLETMRTESNGAVYLLDRHMQRLQNSCRYFGFCCDLAEIRRAVTKAAMECEKADCLRLLLSSGGDYQLQRRPLSLSGSLTTLHLSSVRVDSRDPFLYHKTTRRQVYENARLESDFQSDVILANEHGEVTETTLANLAFQRNNRWVTPKVSCGLLPGTMRAELLSTKELVESVIHLAELNMGEVVRCFNSVRGVFDLPLMPTRNRVREEQH